MVGISIPYFFSFRKRFGEIHTVDGIRAVYSEGAYWAIYEGEEYAMQGIDTTPIVDGGVYKLVYTLA